MTIFDCEPGFWIGMGALGVLTLAYILVCWLIPPKKRKAEIVTEDMEEAD